MAVSAQSDPIMRCLLIHSSARSKDLKLGNGNGNHFYNSGELNQTSKSKDSPVFLTVTEQFLLNSITLTNIASH